MESLESDRIDQIIQQVAEYDRELQQTLIQFTERFDYPAVQRVLKRV